MPKPRNSSSSFALILSLLLKELIFCFYLDFLKHCIYYNQLKAANSPDKIIMKFVYYLSYLSVKEVNIV